MNFVNFRLCGKKPFPEAGLIINELGCRCFRFLSGCFRSSTSLRMTRIFRIFGFSGSHEPDSSSREPSMDGCGKGESEHCPLFRNCGKISGFFRSGNCCFTTIFAHSNCKTFFAHVTFESQCFSCIYPQILAHFLLTNCSYCLY
jgi:hypothetical protein